MVFSLQCHLELAIGLLFPGATDSLACGTGQSGAPNQTVRRDNTLLWPSEMLYFTVVIAYVLTMCFSGSVFTAYDYHRKRKSSI
jgi:hypothetical protein